MSQRWIVNAIWRDRAGATEDDPWGVDGRYERWLAELRVKGQLIEPGRSNG